MSDLRAKLVEALWFYCGGSAPEALDAILDTLTENAEEWAAEKGNREMTDAAWRAATDEEATALNLLAVLRDTGAD